MENSRISLRQFLLNYTDGQYNTNDVEKQIEVGWFDWFCKDTSLKNRLTPLANFLLSIQETELFSIDDVYVFLKNNCPVNGPLYDSVGIVGMDGDREPYIWVGFMKKGTHSVDHSRVEICISDVLLSSIEENSKLTGCADSGCGSMEEPYVFRKKKDAKNFLLKSKIKPE